MGGVMWEIKSPVGNSKATIGRILKRASKQSRNIVIACFRTTMPDNDIIKTLHFELSKRRQIKRVVLITKSKEIIEIQ